MGEAADSTSAGPSSSAAASSRWPEPTARSSPASYLCTFPFSRRLRKCPHTGLPVTYADIGDPEGTPLLVLMPSGASRWFAAPQDPLAKRYGIRLIVLDRPGVGGTGAVGLADRIKVSCGESLPFGYAQ